MRVLKGRAAQRGDHPLLNVVAECLKRGLEAPERTEDFPLAPREWCTSG